MVQGDVRCPPNWYVNSTPGGNFEHIRKEVLTSQVSPSFVVLVAGTNELGESPQSIGIRLKALLKTTKEKFSGCKVRVLMVFSIISKPWLNLNTRPGTGAQTP